MTPLPAPFRRGRCFAKQIRRRPALMCFPKRAGGAKGGLATLPCVVCRRVVIGSLAAMAMLAACAGEGSGVRSLDASATTTVPTVAPTTTAAPAPSTTEPPVTSPPTITPAPVADTGDGIGDAVFPDLGNPGVDVLDYLVEVSPDQTTDILTGSVTLAIRFTEARSEFTLDSLGPQITAVTIDGDGVAFQADDPELRITPDEPIAAGGTHTVTIDYTVALERDSMRFAPGWVPTAGGSYVLNEPDAARTWLPSNDHPSDKATWTFRITVPTGVTGVGNGRLVGTTAGPAGDTWEWREDDPMPTYLILLLTGDYEIIESATTSGLPLVSVVLRDDLAEMQPFLDTMAAQIEFFEPLFGQYPLERYGLAITDSVPGLAMETQGRSMFSRDDLATLAGDFEQSVLAHELAHQWFGDAVTPALWGDIWLNESFATYAEWLWVEHVGLATVADQAAFSLEYRQSGDGEPTGSPTGELFVFNTYGGGAVVLHALRLTIGDEAFFELLTRWVAENDGASRTTGDFIALAEKVSSSDLGQLFDAWLYADIPPAEYPTGG